MTAKKSDDTKTRTPRPLTTATKRATEALLVKYREELDEMIAGEMEAAGYKQTTVTKWGPA